MTRARGGMDGRCQNCKINLSLCFCDYLKEIQIKSKVSIIMHVSERKLTSNTSWIASKALDNCNIHLRGEVNNPFKGEDVLDDRFIPLFLFPDAGSVELDGDFAKTLHKPVQIIIPDGNWNQAKKVKSREACFKDIKTVRLPQLNESIYSLRRSPFKGAVCTLEAISYALKVLEGESVHNHLMNILKVMVDRTMMARKGL